jgi:Transposase
MEAIGHDTRIRKMLLHWAKVGRGSWRLMRRHAYNLTSEQRHKLTNYLAALPVIQATYGFKQRLCSLLLKKHRTRKQCQKLIPRFLRTVYQLRQAGLAQLV